METYFKLRTITEFVIPAIMGAVVLLFIAWIFLRIKIEDWKELHSKRKILKKLGFKRYKYIDNRHDYVFGIYRRDNPDSEKEELISFSDAQLYRIGSRNLSEIASDYEKYDKYYWRFTTPSERDRIVHSKHYNG